MKCDICQQEFQPGDKLWVTPIKEVMNTEEVQKVMHYACYEKDLSDRAAKQQLMPRRIIMKES